MDNNELLAQIQILLEHQTENIQEELNAINIKIENDVTNRINSLFDGYKLTHEKQWELEKRIEAIERKLNIA